MEEEEGKNGRREQWREMKGRNRKTGKIEGWEYGRRENRGGRRTRAEMEGKREESRAGGKKGERWKEEKAVGWKGGRLGRRESRGRGEQGPKWKKKGGKR